MNNFNNRGKIAGSYEELQSLDILRSERNKHPLSKASQTSSMRAVLQAIEICLLNLTDLLNRTNTDTTHEAFGNAVVKMSWLAGFHRLLSRLSEMPYSLPKITEENKNELSTLKFGDSPALKSYLFSLKSYDSCIIKLIEGKKIKIDSLFSNESIDNNQLNLLHLTRICNHETNIWGTNLENTSIEIQVGSYEDFILTDSIREAVFGFKLEGDTFFTQFRGLHQISEILGEEVNDHIEESIGRISQNKIREAIEHLSIANSLFKGIIGSLIPMIDNLSTSDYHKIRENLGLTSGSHSVCLHYHMFKDLYHKLCKELFALLTQKSSSRGDKSKSESLRNIIREIDAKRFIDLDSWLLHLLLNECVQLDIFIIHWRQLHLHLPRNELGAKGIKSLTGSLDAIDTTFQMYETATKNDPLGLIFQARGIERKTKANLSRIFESENSLDSCLGREIGRVTKERFRDVQERIGDFSNKCPFIPPPPRL